MSKTWKDKTFYSRIGSAGGNKVTERKREGLRRARKAKRIKRELRRLGIE